MADELQTPVEGDEALTSHNYDGIQEYDNPTPGWWNWLFIATIIWAPLYCIWFHSPVESRTLDAQYERAMAANMQLRFGELEGIKADELTLVQLMERTYGDGSDWLESGAASYRANCATCHGQRGEGNNGPNLTDNVYKPENVKQLTDIAKVVSNGAKAGAMPAWKDKLHPVELVLVTAYAASLRGNDEVGRAPEGKKVAPWPTLEEAQANAPEDDATESEETEESKEAETT